MNITIQEPGGPREGIVPFEGIHTEAALIKSLIMTLAKESNFCVGNLTLQVDLTGTDPTRLVAVAKMISGEERVSMNRASTHH